ncbi:hypothetical protein J5X84_32745 [Streptosporangiaceae bacterium NEAU-GS5]|nr:hypothetical protein [Streptosporangiaceae bacterium NEAU-GS5]
MRQPQIHAEPERLPRPALPPGPTTAPTRAPAGSAAAGSTGTAGGAAGSAADTSDGVQRIGKPPGGRPARPARADVLVALGPPRPGGGRHHRRPEPKPKRLPRRRSRFGTIAVLVTLLVAAVLGVGVVRWVRTPTGAGFALSAGDGQTGDTAFQAPGLPGNGSNQTLNAITSSGTTVVAVGSDISGQTPKPLFLVSSDGGRMWESGRVVGVAAYEQIAGAVGRVAGGNGRWLAVGIDAPGAAGPAARGMWTSPDGRTWTAVNPDQLTAFWSQDRISDVARTSAGFVAVGSTVLQDGTTGAVSWISPDGERWTRIDTGQIGPPSQVRAMRAVVARGDQVVALADPSNGDATSVIMRSADGGGTWLRSATAIPSVRPEPGALAVTKQGFLLVPTRQTTGNGQVNVYCSPEGAQWGQCGSIGRLSAEGAGVRGLASSAAGIAAVTESAWERYDLYTSSDGRTWTKSADLGEIPGTLRGLTITDSGTLVASGDKRGQGDVENLPVLMTAQKGKSAEAVPLEAIAGLSRLAHDVTSVASAGGAFVAVGSANGDAGIWVSGNNGANWRAVTSQWLGGSGRQALTGVAHGPQGWLAVGGTTSNPAVTGPLLLTSTDGRNWRPGPQVEVPPGRVSLVPEVVAGGKKGFVLAGVDRSTTDMRAAMWFTPDLKRFTRVSPADLPSAGVGVRIYDIAITPYGFMAVGGYGPTGRESGAVWISSDGVNWRAQTRVVPDGADAAGLRQVVASGSDIVAVGTASGRSFSAVTSDNGASWKYAWLPGEEKAAVLDLAATGQGLVAVGAYGDPGEGDSMAWTSYDGLQWREQPVTEDGLGGAGAQWLGAISVSGTHVVAVGRSTTFTADHLMIWRTTVSE